MNEYQVIYSKLPGYEKKIELYNFDYAIYVVPDIASEPQILKKNVGSYFSAKTDVWKPVWWNAESAHTACYIFHFINYRLIPHKDEVMCTGKSCRS